MRKRFRVVAKVSLLVSFDDERATTKTAEYIASAVGLELLKEGVRKGLDGMFEVENDGKPEIISSAEIESGLRDAR